MDKQLRFLGSLKGHGQIQMPAVVALVQAEPAQLELFHPDDVITLQRVIQLIELLLVKVKAMDDNLLKHQSLTQDVLSTFTALLALLRS